jgi:hypothetical protein
LGGDMADESSPNLSSESRKESINTLGEAAINTPKSVKNKKHIRIRAKSLERSRNNIKYELFEKAVRYFLLKIQFMKKKNIDFSLPKRWEYIKKKGSLKSQIYIENVEKYTDTPLSPEQKPFRPSKF